MKKLAFQNRKVTIETAPDPTPGPGEVVVRTKLLPICGSDLHAYHSEARCEWGGHEGVGEIAAIGPGARRKVGQRVIIQPLSGCGQCPECLSGDFIYCVGEKPPAQGHYAELIPKLDWLTTPIPGDLSWELASLMGCALSPAHRSIRRMKLRPHEHLLVTGLGPVGLGATALGKFVNATVIAVDLEPYRRNLARDLGADHLLDPREGEVLAAIREITKGRGVECSVDCAGAEDSQTLCLEAACIGGRVSFVGEKSGNLSIRPGPQFLRKGIVLFGNWHENLNHYGEMAEFLRRFPQASKIITHTFPFAKAQEAFDLFVTRKTGKVVLRIGEQAHC